MSKAYIHITNLSFRYETAIEPLYDGLSLTIGEGWTGVVGANGVGKTTFLLLATGRLTPSEGAVSIPGHVSYVAQRTDNPPEGLGAFLRAYDAIAYRLCETLKVTDEFEVRWPTLSDGERKRAQMAVALWHEPLVMAVDEPTNHLDADAREIVTSALASFRGVGLIVSHDRALLDSLCTRCLFLSSAHAVIRPGGVSAGLETEEREMDFQRDQYRKSKEEVARLTREAEHRSRAAAAATKRNSKRSISRKDVAAKSDMDVARITGKDAVAGKLLRQLDGRIRRAEARLTESTPPPKRKLGISLSGKASRADTVYRCPEGGISIGSRVLHHPALEIGPTDRIGLVGPNGGGKTTLVRRIVDELPSDRVLYIPQEIPERTSVALAERLRRLPTDELAMILSAVSRLGSDPEALRSSTVPSPGETRKLILAEGLLSQPALVVMDEPTNHMDLPSIRYVEEALRETDCALLLVSHDLFFLSNLTSKTWRVVEEGDGMNLHVT